MTQKVSPGMTDAQFSYLVLVIDDEPGITHLCQRLLERAGFRIRAVTAASEGVAILEQEHVDLLLVDIRMPGLDGFQVIDLARHHQPDLAVVIMTGYGTVETAIEALRRGADGLILKPFAGAELVQSVKRALQESRHKKDVVRLQTLRPLFTITETLFTETNPDRLQELLLETVLGHLHCSMAGLYERQQGASELRLVAGRGDLPPEEEVDPERSLVGRAAAWGIPLSANREGPGDAGLQATLASRGLVSLMAAPLSAPLKLPDSAHEGGRILAAGRKTGEAPFRESDLEIFAILSRQAAIALENASLHAELHAYIARVEESQRALIQAEKMAIAGRLTASIAHEINNPLQSVQNCLHLAGRKELPRRERQNYLAMAQAELERLMHTVQRMLDYYRPAALDRKPVKINDLVNRVLSLVGPQLAERQIRLESRLTQALPDIWAVADQIQQVLLNLLLNAMEALPAGGIITIETGPWRGGIAVTVEDNGPGIDKRHREHIFEPFFSSKEGGTGLGLAISYGIVAAHGGSLDLVQGRGKGACFRILLPSGEAP